MSYYFCGCKSFCTKCFLWFPMPSSQPAIVYGASHFHCCSSLCPSPLCQCLNVFASATMCVCVCVYFVCTGNLHVEIEEALCSTNKVSDNRIHLQQTQSRRLYKNRATKILRNDFFLLPVRRHLTTTINTKIVHCSSRSCFFFVSIHKTLSYVSRVRASGCECVCATKVVASRNENALDKDSVLLLKGELQLDRV